MLQFPAQNLQMGREKSLQTDGLAFGETNLCYLPTCFNELILFRGHIREGISQPSRSSVFYLHSPSGTNPKMASVQIVLSKNL